MRSFNNFLYECVKCVGLHILSSNAKQSLQRSIYAWRLKTGNHTEEPEMGIIEYFIRKGSTVIDVGANLGKYTNSFHKIVGSEGRVLAFEPVKDTYEQLAYNHRKLRWSNVEIYQIALSDHTGVYRMRTPIGKNGTKLLGLSYIDGDNDVEQPCAVSTVRTLRLDDMELNLKNLDFIKCDVEGAELKVLKGAEMTLLNFKPAIMAEIEDKHLMKYGINAGDVFGYLHSIGYLPYYYDGSRLLKCKMLKNNFNNYLFVHGERDYYAKLAILNIDNKYA